MTTDKERERAAFEAWCDTRGFVHVGYSTNRAWDAWQARAELAAVAEPVAWMRPSTEGYDSAFRDAETIRLCTGTDWLAEGWIPLYASPPPAPASAIPVAIAFPLALRVESVKAIAATCKEKGMVARISGSNVFCEKP